MKQETFDKIDSIYKRLEASKGKISYAILCREANTSKRNISEYFKTKERRGTTGTSTAGTENGTASTIGTCGTSTTGTESGTTGTAGTGTNSTTPKYTPSTSFRSPEEVNRLANYLLSNEKKEVTQEEIFTRYAENGEFDSFVKEMNFIRRNVGKLFLKCKPLLIQLIEPFPSEYKEKALKELNRPVQN